MESAVAMHSGAAIPKTMTGLCTIWLRSMVSRQYSSSTLVRLPLAAREMPAARRAQKRVLPKPAAATLMAPTMITVPFEKQPRASEALRQPVSVSAARDAMATVARLHTPVI